jgi:membrane fusion protein (multidrug efflux system)
MDKDPTMASPELVPDAPLPPAPAAPPRRRIPPLAIVGVIALGFALYGLRAVLHGRHHVGSDNAQVDGHIAAMAPKVQAFVERVLVEDNQTVRAGDTLVVLDTRELRLRLAQAQADLAIAQASLGAQGRLGQAQAQLEASQATAQGAQASIASAEAGYRKAQSDLGRIRGLAAQHIVAAQQLDAAQAAFDAARANLDAVRRQASAAQSQVSASGAGVSIAVARLAGARTAVESAQLNLSYAYITAPFAGTVARRSVEPGALVQVGQSLMSLVHDSSLWVTANLKETQLRTVQVGDKVEIEVDAYPGVSFRGHVISLSPATGARFALLPPDNATGNFTKVVQRLPVRIAVDGPRDPARPLRAGMSVTVDIETR